jgi:hypothetical protein
MAMEADLIIAVMGVVIIAMGGMVAVARVHGRWCTNSVWQPRTSA